MQLAEIEISNYKSFFSTMKFSFGPGFNILLGANSSGKTTVLEAIQFMETPPVPHYSIANIIDIDTPWNKPTNIKTRFQIQISELQKVFIQSQLIIPFEDRGGRMFNPSATRQDWESNGIQFSFERAIPGNLTMQIFSQGTPSKIRDGREHLPSARATLGREGITYPERPNIGIQNDNLVDVNLLTKRINSSTYRFSAERVVRSISPASHPELAPDASNLPYCIAHLKASDEVISERLIKYVNRIFPSIQSITSIPRHNGDFELKVQTFSREISRPDLAIPMDRVGTGVSNAIAMLYVTLTARTPKIILLEEPNSFLHPRALRELLVILAEAGAMHQFFVTTHSSDVLRSIDPSTVTLLENDGVQTTGKQTHHDNLASFQAGLLDLGIRLTDLHGCDSVLWVEGETEEAIFPLILGKFFPSVAQGIATLRLHATGDFESRKIKADKVAAIYRRLSEATFLAPPMVAITLDREDRRPEQIEALSQNTAGLVQFLPRTMIEDYLAIPDAISAIIFLEYKIATNPVEIREAIERAKVEKRNRVRPDSQGNSPLHYAKILKEVFENFAGPGNEYEKARHGPLLANWILENCPENFEELRQWFSTFIRIVR